MSYLISFLGWWRGCEDFKRNWYITLIEMFRINLLKIYQFFRCKVSLSYLSCTLYTWWLWSKPHLTSITLSLLLIIFCGNLSLLVQSWKFKTAAHDCWILAYYIYLFTVDLRGNAQYQHIFSTHFISVASS